MENPQCKASKTPNIKENVKRLSNYSVRLMVVEIWKRESKVVSRYILHLFENQEEKGGKQLTAGRTRSLRALELAPRYDPNARLLDGYDISHIRLVKG
jgi:hypothetical protein